MLLALGDSRLYHIRIETSCARYGVVLIYTRVDFFFVFYTSLTLGIL